MLCQEEKGTGLSMPESCSSKDSPQPHAGRLAAPVYVYDPVYLEHDTGGHPENARRLQAIISDLDLEGHQAATERNSSTPGYPG